MAFAGIFQSLARLRRIRFGLLMWAANSRAAFLFHKTEELRASASEFPPFPYRPSGNGSSEQVQALLPQR